MKKAALVLSVFICLAGKAQYSKPQCPPGYDHVGGGWQIDKFNFHKPRTECTSQFGVCLKTTKIIVCQSATTTISLPYLRGQTAHCFVTIREGMATLYLPLSLKEDPEYSEGDLSRFYVEERMVSFKNEDDSWIVYLKEGEYEVEETDKALVIKIPVES